MALTIAPKVLNKINNKENLPDNLEKLKPILINRKNDLEVLTAPPEEDD